MERCLTFRDTGTSNDRLSDFLDDRFGKNCFIFWKRTETFQEKTVIADIMRFPGIFLLTSLGFTPLSVSIDESQLLLVDEPYAEAQTTVKVSRSLSCGTSKQRLDDYIRKDKYVIGIHTEHDQETYIYNHELIFQEYLTATAGQKFDPPIKFELIPVNLEQIVASIDTQDVDFFYANPGFFSCVGTEVGAIALNTVSTTPTIQHASRVLDPHQHPIFVHFISILTGHPSSYGSGTYLRS